MAAPRRRQSQPTVDTVTVGCKLPNGLVLQLFKEEEYNEAVPGGFRTAKRAIKLPESYTLYGSALPPGAIRSGNLPYPIVHGAAMTSGVPREFWEKWVEANRESLLVKNQIVFAHREEASVRAMAAELKGRKTGLEPIDPDPEALNRVVQPPRGTRIEKLNTAEP